MSARGRSRSPKPLSPSPSRSRTPMSMSPPPKARDEAGFNVIVVSGLTRNVQRAHLEEIFGEYGKVTGVDLPVFRQSGINRGKAAIEFSAPSQAKKAFECMDGGQLDGSVLNVVISEHPLPAPRPLSPLRRSRSPPPRRRPDSRSRSPPPRRRRSHSRSRSPPRRGPGGPGGYGYGPGRGGFGGGPRGGGGGGGFRNDRRPSPPPARRFGDRGAPRRRSPSYERGGRRSPSRSRSRSRSLSRSRSPPRRRRSYSRSSSGSSRSRSYSRSVSKSPVRK